MNNFDLYNNLDPNIKKYMTDMHNLTKLVIKKELKEIIFKICDKYNLDKNEVSKEFLSDNITDNNSDEDTNLVENKYKCIAITKQNKQCSRNKYECNPYCKNHLRLSKLPNGLQLGTIHKRIIPQENSILESISSQINSDEIILDEVTINNEQLFHDRNNNVYYKKDKDNNAIKTLITN